MTRDDAIAEQERLFPCGKTIIMLPEICLDLRASINGAADPWPTAVLAEIVAMLQSRLDTWEWPSDAIDGHVRGMVQQAIWLGRAEEAQQLTEEKP